MNLRSVFSTRPRAGARIGLGSYLAIAFSLLAVLVTAVLVLVSEHYASQSVRRSIGANLAELANQTTSRLDRSMYERYREVRLMAERVSGEGDPARLRWELDAALRTFPYYAWIGLTDPAGTVRAASGGLLEGADVSGRDWFRRIAQGSNVGDVHEAQLLARLLVNPSGEPMRFVDIAFPVPAAKGAPAGVLGVHLSWDWARDVQKAIFLPTGEGREVEPLIVSRSGIVLLGPPDVIGREIELPSLRAVATGAAGYLSESWPDGKEYLVGYARDKGYQGYPGLGWRVLVRQELQEAYAPVRLLQSRLLAWGLGITVLFSLLGWVAARIITRPLKNLASVARQLEAGEPARPSAGGRYLEVSQLGGAFQSLVAALQRQEADLRELNATLERRVEKRTAELQAAFQRVRDNVLRVQTIIDSAPDPFVGTDFEGRITDWNPRAEQLLGWRRDEVLGRPLVEVIMPPRYVEATRQALREFVATGQSRFVGPSLERTVIDRAGREIEVEMRIGLIDRAGLQVLSAFLRDVSQRKEVERLKSQFVSTVSHELRTPLTAIYGSLSLLASGVMGALPPAVERLVAMSKQSCERLTRLVNDVLDVEKIASGQLRYQFSRLDLQALVAQSVRDTQPFADRHQVGLRLEPGQPVPVRADADRLVQVLMNLLSNAAKFAPRDSMVEVSLRAGEATVRVGVLDRGAGVPQAFRARMFERFAQADGSDQRQKGGTGLGLNICRSIVEGHGGRIGFDSEPGRTEFFFELPLAPDA